VEQQLACNQPLTSEQQAHLADCPACRDKQADFQQLDRQLKAAFDTQAPDDFSDRVMAALEQEPATEPVMMERLLASLPFRVGLIATALLVLLGHIVRFFLTAFIVTMAAT
jgi:anti-sigma factor RsiW